MSAIVYRSLLQLLAEKDLDGFSKGTVASLWTAKHRVTGDHRLMIMPSYAQRSGTSAACCNMSSDM